MSRVEVPERFSNLVAGLCVAISTQARCDSASRPSHDFTPSLHDSPDGLLRAELGDGGLVINVPHVDPLSNQPPNLIDHAA